MRRSQDGIPPSDKKAKKKKKKGNEWLFVNPYLIVGIIGASLSFGWMLSLLLMPDVPGIEVLGDQGSQVFRLAFAASLVVFYFLVSLVSNALQRHRLAVAVVSFASILVSCGLGLVTAPAEMALVLVIVRVCAAGLSVSLLTTLWIEFLCCYLKPEIRQVVAAVFVMAFVWYLGILLSSQGLALIEQALMAVLSCAIYVVLHYRYAPMEAMPFIEAADSDIRYPITWQPGLLTIMGSLAQGFALYWLLAPVGNAQFSACAVCLVALVVCIAVLIDSLKKFVLREFVIRRMFLPVLTACVLSELFIPREWLFIPCLVAWGFSVLPYLSAIMATCEHIVRCYLSAFRSYARARLFAAAGLVAGLGIGWLAFAANLFGSVNLQVWVFVVVMFFVIVSTTVPLESFYPGDEPLFDGTVRINVNGEMVSSEELPNLVDGSRYFKERCDAVAAYYGLTARQTEVLYLLAKGRNASYIQDKFVISPHTVKAHIYTIYKKTNQHSQQDLMDLVEGFDVGGRDEGSEQASD